MILTQTNEQAFEALVEKDLVARRYILYPKVFFTSTNTAGALKLNDYTFDGSKLKIINDLSIFQKIYFLAEF